MDKAGEIEPKKLYEPPELVVYGTVQDLTNTVANRRMPDGGTGPHVGHRTSIT